MKQIPDFKGKVKREGAPIWMKEEVFEDAEERARNQIREIEYYKELVDGLPESD